MTKLELGSESTSPECYRYDGIVIHLSFVTMTSTIAAHTLKLHDLKTRFNLQKNEAADFFGEWLVQGTPLNELERAALDRLKRNYLYLLEYPVSEFLFLKLQPSDPPQYATSNLFSMLNQGHDLYGVLQILKQLQALISESA
jgi:hypothetical protein